MRISLMGSVKKKLHGVLATWALTGLRYASSNTTGYEYIVPVSEPILLLLLTRDSV